MLLRRCGHHDGRRAAAAPDPVGLVPPGLGAGERVIRFLRRALVGNHREHLTSAAAAPGSLLDQHRAERVAGDGDSGNDAGSAVLR